jgi:hypothetical protein
MRKRKSKNLTAECAENAEKDAERRIKYVDQAESQTFDFYCALAYS